MIVFLCRENFENGFATDKKLNLRNQRTKNNAGL
jgi:hypothetical protein